jgi:hypothetical protein
VSGIRSRKIRASSPAWGVVKVQHAHRGKKSVGQITSARIKKKGHHLAVFRRQGIINRPFKPDSPVATTSGDSGASAPSFAFGGIVPLLRGIAPPTSGEAGYSIPMGRGAASYPPPRCARDWWWCWRCKSGLKPASSSSGRGVSGRSSCCCCGAGGCGLLREEEKMLMCGICTGIARDCGSCRSACSGLRRSARRCSAVLFPDEGGEPPGD